MTSQHAAQAKTTQSAQPAPQAPAPQKPTAHPLLHLQRQVGNQAATSIIQAKLTVGEPHDVYEQEADRVAAAVVNQIHAAPEQATQSALQTKPRIQRMSDVAGIAVSPDVESAIQQARGSGQPLDESIRVPMEQAFGADFSGVRVHADGESDRLARSIQARAFTTGQNIFFQPGEYQPTSRSGQELLAHELTHIVQQNENVSSGNSNIRRSPQPMIQRNPTQADRDHLSGVLTHQYYAQNQLKHLNFNNLTNPDQTTLQHYMQNAAIQAATAETGFFHQNQSGLLPKYDWISKRVSPYIEFNMAFAAFNRLVYDVLESTIYITPHYNGYIQISNAPFAVLSRLNSIVATNVGYLLNEEDSDLNTKLATAVGKINALRTIIRSEP
nr:MAG: DUF4157 domain-containing protein [Leptolyngbya sp. IPPAS B-1204]